MRTDLMREFAAGREIVGVTPQGDYVLEQVPYERNARDH